MKTWIKIVIGVGIVVAIAGFVGWRVMAGNLQKPVRTAQVSYQTISKDIAFTASVTSKQSSDLAFELTGSIQHIYVKVGDNVVAGQRLAALNPESVELELAKATADKESSTSVEYIAWQKADQDLKLTKTENAKSLEQKRQAVRDAKTALDQSKEVFQAKADESGDDSSLALGTYSSVVANETAYHAAQKALETALATVKKSNESAQKTADLAHAQYINTLQASSTNPGLSSLGALQKLAQVKAAKSVLRAPFTGVVTKRSAEIGELATAGQSVFTIETTSNLELTADIPETDALTLASGMTGDVTFDALPSKQAIQTHIESIDPAAVILQGVPTFHITLPLNGDVSDLRSGLTSNVVVHVAKKDHVLGIPRRAISIKQGEEYVKVQKDDKTEEERKVTTGLVGSDGTVEITSGLSEGDIVVIP